MKLAIIVILVAILASLGSGLVFLARDKDGSSRVLRALTIRITLSVVLFLLLMAAWLAGWIQPNATPLNGLIAPFVSVDPYLWLKWLHIVAACVAFGSNVTHFFWLIGARNDSRGRASILRLIKKIDDRLAVPAYVVTILCGAVMWYWRWPANSSWVVVSLALTVVLAAMGIAYGPLMKRWIRAAETETPGAADSFPLARGLTAWWAAISLSVLVVLYLMVWKPALW